MEALKRLRFIPSGIEGELSGNGFMFGALAGGVNYTETRENLYEEDEERIHYNTDDVTVEKAKSYINEASYGGKTDEELDNSFKPTYKKDKEDYLKEIEEEKSEPD